MRVRRLKILGVAGFLLLCVCGCSALPKNFEKAYSTAILDGDSTELGRLFQTSLRDQPGESGVFLLSNGLDAFVGRALLAEKAERSIDVQYYMFHQDTVGKLLLRSLLKAADRKVRVRLLIDDMYGADADDVWTALDSHPNMEVRLFNPFVRGRSKALQFLTRFSDVNYRMHSKSFTVDNQATIVGGRNIGDEYFDANPDLAFVDIDVLAIGPVVPEVSAAFDEYWNSTYAYPASILAGPRQPEQLTEQKEALDDFYWQQQATIYRNALETSELATALRAGSARFEWAEAEVIHDSSEKKERGENWQQELLISQLWPYVETATEELLIISPYFVPGKKGAEALCGLSEKGVQVHILTNSLASNDVSAVHAGYSRYRKQLLKAGVKLYELDEEIKEEIAETFSWLPGLSKSSLHAKTMVLDRKAMFVGSMNLDLRSLHINNEIGILFFNDVMAARNAREFLNNLGRAAFRVELDDDGSLIWKISKNGEDVVYRDEPYADFWTKLSVWVARLLPIESLL
jgi:putative cardiolipin synthase